jgi:hypothetical protein
MFGAEIGIDIKVGSRCITIQGLTEAELQALVHTGARDFGE